jgi:hypothetical protein
MILWSFMLVTFTTEAYADITMFGDVAKQMLKMMGNSGNIPGAMLAEDIPAAVERLQVAIQNNDALDEQINDTDDDEPKVSLSTRAIPLIELMKSAAEQGKNVMWDETS